MASDADDCNDIEAMPEIAGSQESGCAVEFSKECTGKNSSAENPIAASSGISTVRASTARDLTRPIAKKTFEEGNHRRTIFRHIRNSTVNQQADGGVPAASVDNIKQAQQKQLAIETLVSGATVKKQTENSCRRFESLMDVSEMMEKLPPTSSTTSRIDKGKRMGICLEALSLSNHLLPHLAQSDRAVIETEQREEEVGDFEGTELATMEKGFGVSGCGIHRADAIVACPREGKGKKKSLIAAERTSGNDIDGEDTSDIVADIPSPGEASSSLATYSQFSMAFARSRSTGRFSGAKTTTAQFFVSKRKRFGKVRGHHHRWSRIGKHNIDVDLGRADLPSFRQVKNTAASMMSESSTETSKDVKIPDRAAFHGPKEFRSMPAIVLEPSLSPGAAAETQTEKREDEHSELPMLWVRGSRPWRTWKRVIASVNTLPHIGPVLLLHSVDKYLSMKKNSHEYIPLSSSLIEISQTVNRNSKIFSIGRFRQQGLFRFSVAVNGVMYQFATDAVADRDTWISTLRYESLPRTRCHSLLILEDDGQESR